MRIAVQNISGFVARSWVVCGIPGELHGWHWLVLEDGRKFPAHGEGMEVLIRADLRPRELVRGRLEPMQPSDFPKWQSPKWAMDDLRQLVPTFECDGIESARIISEVVEQSDARVILHTVSMLRSWNLSIEAWWSLFSGQDHIEFEIRCVYGTTVERGWQLPQPSLRMRIGEYPHIDYRLPKGLSEPIPTFLDDGSVRWDAEIAAPGTWTRGRTIEVTGALLCMPYRIADAQKDPERAANLTHRKEAPVTAICLDWNGKWLSFGAVPRQPPTASIEQRRRFNAMVDRLHRVGSEYDTRPYAQPQYSGTTGEQEEFGASRCEHAVSMGEPWAVWDLRYSAQAEGLRPTANIEPTGMPVRAADHPNCKTWNRIPDWRVSQDMLGWPKEGLWISGYSPEDGQHMSDNIITGVYALTRSRSLRRTLENNLQMDLLHRHRGTPMPAIGSGTGSPRGVGRTLMAWCHAFNVGLREYEPLIREAVERAYISAFWRVLPVMENRTLVSPMWLNPEGAKYGWRGQDGLPIRGWTTWEESIAVMGFFAAWRTFGMPEARELATVAAENIVRHGIFQENGNWRICYALRWKEGGEPHDEAAYLRPKPNYDVWAGDVTPAWVMPALEILLELSPENPMAAKAQTILDAFPIQNWRDACWRAVR